MIGFVDHVRETQYVTISRGFIHFLQSIGHENILAHRIDLDVETTPMELETFINSIGNPSFYTYKELEGFAGHFNLDEEYRAMMLYGLGYVLYDDMCMEKYAILQAMYRGQTTSSLSLALDRFDTNTLNVLITDLYDIRSTQDRRDFPRLARFIEDGMAVYVMGFEGGFLGYLYDFVPGASIQVGSRPSTHYYEGEWGTRTYELRPFYIIVAGNIEDVYPIVNGFIAYIEDIFGRAFNHITYEGILFHSLFPIVEISEARQSSYRSNPENRILQVDPAEGHDDTHAFQVNNRGDDGYRTIYIDLPFNDAPLTGHRILQIDDWIVTTSTIQEGQSTTSADINVSSKHMHDGYLRLAFELGNIPAGRYFVDVTIYFRAPEIYSYDPEIARDCAFSHWDWTIPDGRLADLVAGGDSIAPYNRTLGLCIFLANLANTSAVLTDEYITTFQLQFNVI